MSTLRGHLEHYGRLTKLGFTLRHEYVMGVARILLIKASTVLRGLYGSSTEDHGSDVLRIPGDRISWNMYPKTLRVCTDPGYLLSCHSGAQPFVGASRQGGGVSGGSHKSGLAGIDSLMEYYRLHEKRAHPLP